MSDILLAFELDCSGFYGSCLCGCCACLFEFVIRMRYMLCSWAWTIWCLKNVCYIFVCYISIYIHTLTLYYSRMFFSLLSHFGLFLREVNSVHAENNMINKN